VKRPEPVEGLVIRYDFLWNDEHRRGRIDGQKDRPCAIIIAAPEGNPESGGKIDRIIVAPITHSSPQKGTAAIEVPLKVKRHLGLDEGRSWIILSELNRLRWSDPGIVPVSKSRWTYGSLPQAFVITVQEQVRELARSQKVNLIDRK
jgi:hypothetical protein